MSFTVTGKTAQQIYDVLNEQYIKEFSDLESKLIAVETLRGTISRQNDKLSSVSHIATASSSATKADTRADALAKSTLESSVRAELDSLKTMQNGFLTDNRKLTIALERSKVFENELTQSIDKFRTIAIPDVAIQSLEFLDPELKQKAIELSSIALRNLAVLEGFLSNVSSIRSKFEGRLPNVTRELRNFCSNVRIKEDALNGTSPSVLGSLSSLFFSRPLPEAPPSLLEVAAVAVAVAPASAVAVAPASAVAEPAAASPSGSLAAPGLPAKRPAGSKATPITPKPPIISSEAKAPMREPREAIA